GVNDGDEMPGPRRPYAPTPQQLTTPPTIAQVASRSAWPPPFPNAVTVPGPIGETGMAELWLSLFPSSPLSPSPQHSRPPASSAHVWYAASCGSVWMLASAVVGALIVAGVVRPVPSAPNWLSPQQ